MSTEVGALNASLTLDLSEFKAGMSEAASLAAELGMQLQSAFNGDAGISRLTAELGEMLAEIKNLQGAVEGFQASLNSMSGASVFAEMRTYTAALPADIAAISSALDVADLAAIQLGITMQEVATAAQSVASALSGIQASAGVGTPTMDFSTAVSQIETIQSGLADILTMLQSLGTVDVNTGELLGNGDQTSAIFNTLNTVAAINTSMQETVGILQQCTAAAQEWNNVMQQVATSAASIYGNIMGAGNATRGVRTGMNGAAAGGRNAATQAGKVSKNLQTAKGYAISVKGILGGIVISQAFYQLLNIMEELVHGAIEFSENMQDAGVAFKYLMQDASVSSDAFLNALKDIALQSPLDTTDLTSASRKLMAMGFSAKATVPTLQILTDTAATFSNGAGEMSDMIDHIALAFGQMLASGKVSAQELRQLYNAGLPIYQLLSDGLGITMEQAKNIGKMGVDSATAVYAVLKQLQKRYSGAAAELSTTFAGATQVIKESLQQLLSYSWAPQFAALTTWVDKLAARLKALVKITQAYGTGGLFQALVPQSLWGPLRMVIGGIGQIISALKMLGSVVATVFGGAFRILIQVGSVVIPIIGTIAQTVMLLVQAALKASPALRFLLSAIVALAIAGVIAKIVLFLGKAIWFLTGAKAVAASLVAVAKGIATLWAASRPATIALLAVAAAFLAIVAASERARAAIAGFFGGMAKKAEGFAQNLNLGFNPDDIAMPKFDPPDTADFSDGLKDLTGNMDDLGDSTEKAGKKAKKSLQSFDEVFTIDDDSDSGAGNAASNLADSLAGLGNLDYSNLFDWTGDWATDWGNLTAGLGDLSDLGDPITVSFGDIGKAILDFWNSLTDGDSNGGLLAIDALTLALVALGKLKWAGALKVVEGIGEIAETIRDICKEGLTFDNFLDLVHGLSDVALGIGLLVGNIKLIGWSLAIQGLTEVIQEIAENWDAIKKGDWSGVDKVVLIIGALKIIGGLIMALAAFKTIKGASETATALAPVKEVTNTTKELTGQTSTLTGNLTTLIKNLALGIVILAEVAAAALLFIGAIWLLGKELEQVGLAWQPVIDNAATVATAVAVGTAMLYIIGNVTAALGSMGTTLIVNVALGAAILAEVGVAAGIFIAEIWGLGILLNKIGEAWQPVLDNGANIAKAIGFGTLILVAVGAASAALGMATVASAGLLPLAIALGAAILVELGAATAIFIAEIWGIGKALEQVGIAWQPVLDNGETIKTAIATGTALLIGIGVVTAALGVATVASAGLLPVAIGLGTAILGELAIAFTDFINDLVIVADDLGNKLAPALSDLNGKLPDLVTNMTNFVDFMTQLASATASYTSSMGSMTWDNIVSDFCSFFTGSPIGNLADDIEDITSDLSTLNDKLNAAVPELQDAVDLMTSYSALMARLSVLTQDNGATTLATGMFTNLKTVGENLVLGFNQGVSDKTPDAVNRVKSLAKSITDGFVTGMDSEKPKVTSWIGTFEQDFLTQLKTAFGITGSYATVVTPSGNAVIQGMITGMSDTARTMPNWLTANVSTPVTSWADSNMTTRTLYGHGQNIIAGMQNGIESMRYKVLSTVSSVFQAVKDKIAEIFDIHSPSGVTTAYGEYVDIGMANGMDNQAKNLLATASDLATKVTDSLTPGEVETPKIDLSTVTGTSLDALQNWSVRFVTIVTDAFSQIGALFAALDAQLNTSMTSLNGVSSTLNASTGSMVAADQLGVPTDSTGTQVVQQLLADLTDTTVAKLSAAVADRMYEYLAPLFASLSSSDQERVMAYVGTLIADDTGLKELERKLKVIRVSEGRRG